MIFLKYLLILGESVVLADRQVSELTDVLESADEWSC